MMQTTSQSDAAEMRRLAKHMGRMLRGYRVRAGLSLESLGDKAGLSYQQVQKYETGVNRIPGPRLHTFCQILQVSPEQFFPRFGAELQEDDLSSKRHSRRVTQLIEGFVDAPDEVQTAVLTLLKSRRALGKNRFHQIGSKA